MFSELIAIIVWRQIRNEIGKGQKNIDITDNKEDIDLGKDALDKGIEIAGYGYDSEQDIFYCNMDAWQRNMGYNHMYDEATAPLGMIVDCEPIYFEYGGKGWLIEFWKGQYDLCTGCEVGVYTTEEIESNTPENLKYTFYNCASDEDRLKIVFSLKKHGETLFSRNDKHWWLTGFKLGEFSEPSELTMELSITLKDKTMCNAFVEALKNLGYSENEIIITENTVDLVFDKPRTPQPITRTPETDRITQKKNKLLCDSYQEITKLYGNLRDKIIAAKKQSPELYEEIINKVELKNYLRSIRNSRDI
jgi:hypothetical protein